MALIPTPWGVGEVMLPVLVVRPGPVACFGGVRGCGGRSSVCYSCFRRVVLVTGPLRGRRPPP